MPAVPRDNHNETLAAYRRFIDEIFGRHNAQRAKTIAIERASLAALPANRTVDFEEVLVHVTSTSAFVLRKVFYTVPSRLIGQRLGPQRIPHPAVALYGRYDRRGKVAE